MNDGIAIEEVDGCQDAIPELLFGRDADMAQHGAGQLGEEALDEVEPRAMLGSEGELEAAIGLLGEPGFGLPGDMRGMIVQDKVDRRVGRIGFVETLEERDELAAAMAVLDHGVNLAGHKVDAGQQGDRAVALVFVVAGEGRMNAGLGRQIGGRRRNRLNTGFFRRRRQSPPVGSASASTAPPPS